MRYTTFGRRTGLRVSQYALGTGNFGTGWGAGAEPGEAKKSSGDSSRRAGTSSTSPTCIKPVSPRS